MRIFNIAIIGYGGFGKFLHTHWRALDNVRVTAVADQSAMQFQQLEGIKTFTDWREMLHERDIDLVAIVTEPGTHEEVALACMLAGKHVLIEKPLATTLVAARSIIEMRDHTGMVAGIDFIMRFNPLLQAIRDLTQNGIFGRLRRVDVENYAQDELLPLTHWFWDRDRSGGILIEHAVHFIDLVHFIAPAKMLAVNGLKHDRNPGQEDQIMANVLYEDGLMATHYHDFARPGFFEATKIKFGFDLADIELQGWIPISGELKCLVNPTTKKALMDSPFFELRDSKPIQDVFDESRPEGWGLSNTAETTEQQKVRSGGIFYTVEELLTGKLQIGRSKQEVYAKCVQASLLDVLEKIANPGHRLTASLENGLDSLEVAVRATESARKRNTDDTD